MSERKGTKALELWCKRLVKDCPNVQIENMTTSWRNGIAFCALVHHFRPDLIDMSTLNPENIYKNNHLAFSIAEKHLGIPALLDPEDMVENEVPDRLSILTYLSQFYQRLGHTVSTKPNENDANLSSPKSPASSSQSNAALTFGRVGLDKCVACGQPVYLAQRLIVSHKLYHRQCYRCTKCSAQLNPGNVNNNNSGSEFICDNCINDHPPSKYSSHADAQMGMLAFTDSHDFVEEKVPTPISDTPKRRSQSILDKISIFEKSAEEGIDGKLENLTLKDIDCNRSKNKDDVDIAGGSKNYVIESPNLDKYNQENNDVNETVMNIETKEKTNYNPYESDKKKFAFLQTQLSDEKIDPETNDSGHSELENKTNSSNSIIELKEEPNATDDTRLAYNGCQTLNNEVPENEIIINVPPRRKKRVSIEKGLSNQENIIENTTTTSTSGDEVKKVYPDHLNPFSDDEDEDANPFSDKKRESTNPFGSSDEDDASDVLPPPKIAISQPKSDAPQKRVIAANPFWSDGEEPSSDEESHKDSPMYKSSIASSTPNLRVSTPRRKKAPAPPPPPATISEEMPSIAATSTDDVASLSSMSSFNSTVHSDQKSVGKLTPRLRKRLAPTPPDSVSARSALSEASRDLSTATPVDKGEDLSGSWKQQKRPAPGLPLPARRTVRAALSPERLQAELELLETQQAGLERQGVRLERLIRDKCEGDAAACEEVPQEQVEELVIQLCELVNEKNELFRRQTELMYIRRQQRLEQEQADIEHEIRVIQSRPAVNRIDADKVREEQLVSRLVDLVRLRDELVQQAERERRRERQEDAAIAGTIAAKRAQRSSGSNSSSMKSEVLTTPPKKNKVKDKMKKQFKKAKHTLIPKKKDDSPKKKDDTPRESKGDKPEKAK